MLFADPPLRRARPVPSRRLRAAVAAVVALTVSALVTTSCTSSAPTSDAAEGRSGVARAEAPAANAAGGSSDLTFDLQRERPDTIAVIGDSITVASADRLDEALSALDLDVVAIDAQVGRRMTVGERDRLFTGADIAELVAHERSPELWVIALGTNDVGQYSGVDEVVDQIEALLARLPDGAPVLWVDTWIRSRPDESELVNTAIRTVVGSRADSAVVAWSANAPDAGVLAGDGVHLTTNVGTQRFADVVAAAVDDFLAAP